MQKELAHYPTIPAEGFLLLAKSGFFYDRYGVDPNFTDFSLSLANTGDYIELVDSAFSTAAFVCWGNSDYLEDGCCEGAGEGESLNWIDYSEVEVGIYKEMVFANPDPTPGEIFEKKITVTG